MSSPAPCTPSPSRTTTYDGAPAGHAQHTSQSSIPADAAQPTELSDPPERHLEPSRLQHPRNAITGNTAKFRGNPRTRLHQMPMLRIDPKQRLRIVEIIANLSERIN